jgi:hypothetical protein
VSFLAAQYHMPLMPSRRPKIAEKRY